MRGGPTAGGGGPRPDLSAGPRAGALDPGRIVAVAEMFGDGTSVDAVLERAAVTRFGGSSIVYQHHEERLRVRIDCRRDGREGTVLTESLDPDVLAAQRIRLDAALEVLPPATRAEMAGPGPDPGARSTCFAATVASTPADRIGWFEAVRGRLGPEVDVGGSASDTVTEQVVADTGGLLRHETRTRSALMVVAALGAASSYRKLLHRDASQIDADALAGRVLADMPTGAAHALPASPRVLLGPLAVATLLATFAQLSFGAREMESGSSPLSGRTGDLALSPMLTLRDDGADPAGMPTGFDCQGASKARVDLVTCGVPVAAVHDRTTAARAGVPGTGHAVPPGWRFGIGPAASHLIAQPGPVGDGDLLAALDDGVWVQRVDYVRVLQPRQALVTGTTRDATRVVRGGRVVGAAPQFRFTVRLDRLLRDILAVGTSRERSETVFMESVVAPSLVVPTLGDVEPAGR